MEYSHAGQNRPPRPFFGHKKPKNGPTEKINIPVSSLEQDLSKNMCFTKIGQLGQEWGAGKDTPPLFLKTQKCGAEPPTIFKK